MKRAAAILGVVVSGSVLAGLACQPEEPRTPPNSPLPEVDRKTEPPSAPPTPLSDAGSSSSSSSSSSTSR